MTDEKLYIALTTQLLVAYRHARRHKGSSNSCISFSTDLENGLDELARTIVSRNYTIKRSVRFAVQSPVLREVIAANFRDRIPHHYIFDYVNPHLELELIDDCYSCRIGRGTSYGVKRLEHHIRSCSENYTRPCWVLQLDISGYFMSIDRQRLLKKADALMDRIGRKRDAQGCLLADTYRHQTVAYLLRIVILHDPLSNCEVRDRANLLQLLPPSKSLTHSAPGVGMPIGNLTSQMLSNLYLNEFCHYVKRQLHVRHFGEYVDDTYYVGNDPQWLLSLVPEVDRYLQSEGLHLNLKKTKLTNIYLGVSFLGIHLKPFRRYVKKETLKRIHQQVELLRHVPPSVLADKKVCHHLLSSANSFLGVLVKTSSYRMRCSLFPNYPMFAIANGAPGMKKFIMKNKDKRLPGALAHSHKI